MFNYSKLTHRCTKIILAQSLVNWDLLVKIVETKTIENMKNLILFFSLFIASMSYAQTIDVVVFSERGEEFILFVNSVQQNEVPRANVKAKDLKGDSFVLRIEFLNTQIPTLTKNIYSENKDIELTTVIKQNKKGKYVLRYMGETPKNPETDIYAEESYVVYESPEDNNSTSESNIATSETVTTTTTVTTEHVEVEPHDMNEEVYMNLSVSENGMSVNAGDGEESVSMNISVSETGMDVGAGTDEENINMNISVNATGSDSYVESSETVTTTTTTYTTTSNVTSDEEIYGESMEMDNEIVYDQPVTRCSYAMSSSEFADASESVKSKTFEDDKLTVAKQICRTNCMTSDQIRDMNNLFDFEDTKLEFAKYAYDYVYDISDYYKVNDSFEFDMTIDELNEYLENR